MDKDKSEKFTKPLLTSKAFCDCIRCTCKDCPDILAMLSITVTDTTCHFGSKVNNASKTSEPGESPKPSNLLDVINQNRSCNCEVVARGIRDHVHMNIGMSERREQIKDLVKKCDEHCKEKAIAIANEAINPPAKKISLPWQSDKKKTDSKPCLICDELDKEETEASKTKK